MAIRLKNAREAAVVLRSKGYTLTAICKTLSISKTTVFYWLKNTDAYGRIKHLPPTKETREKASTSIRNKYAAVRDADYAKGLTEYAACSRTPLVKEFLMLFLTEGYRKTRNTVKITNSNPTLILLAQAWLNRWTADISKIKGAVSTYPDHDIKHLKTFWDQLLNISETRIVCFVKAGPGLLKGRKKPLPYGTCSIMVHSTPLRSRLEAWTRCMQEEIL